MVKIRGYLIEPSEVEAALLDTGLVYESAAFGATDDQGKTSLWAYVVPIDGLRSSTAAIVADCGSVYPNTWCRCRSSPLRSYRRTTTTRLIVPC